MSIAQEIFTRVDLSTGLTITTQRAALMQGDKNANRMTAAVFEKGEKLPLAGMTASGQFIRPDGVTVPLKGKIDGNTASVTFGPSCYTVEGSYRAMLFLSIGEESRTIMEISGQIHDRGGDKILDVENIVPSVSDIIAQYAEMKTVTERTLAAAQRAENLQINADGLAGDSNKLGGKAPGYYTSPRNLLDNSDFRNPVNQRGRSGPDLSAGYVIDRWKTWEDGAHAYFVPGKYMGFENVNLFQYFTEPFDRGVLTLAVKVWMQEKPFVCTLDTSQVGSVYNEAGIIIREQNGLAVALIGGFAFEWAALYEGAYTADTLPQYVPKGYTAELAECQRYYRYIGAENWLICHAVSGYGIVVNFPDACNMRITPSVVTYMPQIYTFTTGWVDLSNPVALMKDQGVHVVFENNTEISGKTCLFKGIQELSADL